MTRCGGITETLRIAELAGSGPIPCSVRRSGPHLTDADEGATEFVDGAASFDIGPLELVTLRARPAPISGARP